MIAYLGGLVPEKRPNQVIVDVNGVGYDIQIPVSTFSHLGDGGAECQALNLHPRPRGHSRPLRLPHPQGHNPFRAPDQRQRHRTPPGRFEFRAILAAQCLDIIQPDICVSGGLLELKKIAAMAEAHYVMVPARTCSRSPSWSRTATFRSPPSRVSGWS